MLNDINKKLIFKYKKRIEYAVFSMDKGIMMLEIIYDSRLFKTAVKVVPELDNKAVLWSGIFSAIETYEINPKKYNWFLYLDKGYNTLRHGNLPEGVTYLKGADLIN